MSLGDVSEEHSAVFPVLVVREGFLGEEALELTCRTGFREPG